DAEDRGIRNGELVRLSSRSNATTLRALVTDRVAPGVVYTTFHHPETQANVITTDFTDWATGCPEFKVTAVQVMPSNGPSEWQVAADRRGTGGIGLIGQGMTHLLRRRRAPVPQGRGYRMQSVAVAGFRAYAAGQPERSIRP